MLDLLFRWRWSEEGCLTGKVEIVMRLSILDLTLLVKTETRPDERLVDKGGEGGEKESHEAATAVASISKPAKEVTTPEGVVILDVRVRDPSGKYDISGLGGRGGGAGGRGCIAAFLSGRGGVGEIALIGALADDARRRCSSAKAAEAKGRLFGLSERLKSRLTLGFVRKDILRTDDGRLMVAFAVDA